MSNESDITSLEEEIEDLQKRVAYLERETGYSYDKHQFERTLILVASEDNIETINNNYEGFYGKISGLDAPNLNYAIDEFEKRDGFEYAVVETGEGLGLEVWTGEFPPQ